MRHPFDWYGGLVWLLADRILIWCWAIGIALLIFAFPTEGEKRGFHDF